MPGQRKLKSRKITTFKRVSGCQMIISSIIRREKRYDAKQTMIKSKKRNERRDKFYRSKIIEALEHQIGVRAIGAEPRRPKAYET